MLELIKKYKVRFFSGIFVGILFLLTTISLITYHPLDPSFNRASSDDKVYNAMGVVGAYIADPLLQFFGMAVILISLTFLIWSIQLLMCRRVSFVIFRISLLILCLTIFSSLLALIKTPNNWQFLTMGGYVGYFITNNVVASISTGVLAVLFLLTLIPLAIFTIFVDKDMCKMVMRGIIIMLINIFRYTYIFIKSQVKWVIKKIIYLYRKRNIERNNDENDLSGPIAISNAEEFTSDNRSQELVLNNDEDGEYQLPPIELLSTINNVKNIIDKNLLEQSKHELAKILDDFGIKGEITGIKTGPVVSLYELEPAAGIKSSRVIGLADDIARSMSALSARIAVIPGKNAIGIELPNKKREIVSFKELLESDEHQEHSFNLPLIIGKNIAGGPVIADLTTMPHLLIAGTTGSGKSVSINTMILSLLFNLSPDRCKLIMIDPKMLELAPYQDIPHLLTPVVTDPKKAVMALKWAVSEMENRYKLMSNLGVRNISGYNDKIKELKKKGKKATRTVQTGFDNETGNPIFEEIELDNKEIPYLVVIVDEMADLMLVAGKEIEHNIQRLAQMARAAGIHIIMATQRPSVDVITGIIKANFPTRISFQVTSRVDSRTILDEQGAEQLLGKGDMLMMLGGSKTIRVHAPFITDAEIERIINFLKSQGEPEYIEDLMNDFSGDFSGSSSENGDLSFDDNLSSVNLYDQAVSVILTDKKISISYLQRKLRIGYNKAADLIEKMEEAGIISPPNHSGKRTILVKND